MHISQRYEVDPFSAIWLLGNCRKFFFISLKWGYAFIRMQVIHLSEECALGHHR